MKFQGLIDHCSWKPSFDLNSQSSFCAMPIPHFPHLWKDNREKTVPLCRCCCRATLCDVSWPRVYPQVGRNTGLVQLKRIPITGANYTEYMTKLPGTHKYSNLMKSKARITKELKFRSLKLEAFLVVILCLEQTSVVPLMVLASNVWDYCSLLLDCKWTFPFVN